MVSVQAWLDGQGDRARMMMQVHDELVFEVDAGFVDTLVDEVRRRMVAAAELRVALVVDVGTGANWEEAH